MNLEQVYFIAQIVAAVALVASLVFVGMQMRQSALQQRIATAAGYYDIFRDHMKIMESPELVEAFLRSFEGGTAALTPAEQVKLNVFYTMVIRGYQVLHHHAQQKIFDNDFWEHTQLHLADQLASKYYQEFWALRRHHFTSDFQELVDGLIRTGPRVKIVPAAESGPAAAASPPIVTS